MRTITRLAIAPSALILTAGLLAGCNDPNEDTPTETVSPEDSMEDEDDSMEEEDSMEDEDDSMEEEEDSIEEEEDAMEDEG